MKIKLRNEFIPLNILVLLLVIVIVLFPSSALCIALGLPFLLFFPGYTFISALFPRKTGIDNMERVVLSFVTSIIILPLIGFLLHYSTVGIKVYPVLFSIAIFIFITSIFAWFRRRKLFEQERFHIEFQLTAQSLGRNAWDRATHIILIVAILGTVGALGYFIAVPKITEGFTEFYVLGLDGEVVDYHSYIKKGDAYSIVAGLINNENEITGYRIEIVIDGIKNNDTGPVVLDNKGKWEEIISIYPEKVGDNLKVELILYKNEETKPYLEPIYLWISVSE